VTCMAGILLPPADSTFEKRSSFAKIPSTAVALAAKCHRQRARTAVAHLQGRSLKREAPAQQFFGPIEPPGSDKGQRRLAQCLCKTGSQPLRAEAADGGQVGHAPGSMEIGIDVFTQRLQVKPTPGSDRRSAKQGFHHRVDTQFTLSPTWRQCEPSQSLRRRTGQVIENQNPCRSLRAVGMAGAGWNHQT